MVPPILRQINLRILFWLSLLSSTFPHKPHRIHWDFRLPIWDKSWIHLQLQHHSTADSTDGPAMSCLSACVGSCSTSSNWPQWKAWRCILGREWPTKPYLTGDCLRYNTAKKNQCYPLMIPPGCTHLTANVCQSLLCEIQFKIRISGAFYRMGRRSVNRWNFLGTTTTTMYDQCSSFQQDPTPRISNQYWFSKQCFLGPSTYWLVNGKCVLGHWLSHNKSKCSKPH